MYWLIAPQVRLKMNDKKPSKFQFYFTRVLMYGFCKKLLLSECNSDQLNISWPFLSSLLGGCNSKATANPHKSDDKNCQEMFNWSELHSERSNFLQNPYFSTMVARMWQTPIFSWPFHYSSLEIGRINLETNTNLETNNCWSLN